MKYLLLLLISVNCFADVAKEFKCTKEQSELVAKMTESCAKATESNGTFCLITAIEAVCEKRQ